MESDSEIVESGLSFSNKNVIFPCFHDPGCALREGYNLNRFFLLAPCDPSLKIWTGNIQLLCRHWHSMLIMPVDYFIIVLIWHTKISFLQHPYHLVPQISQNTQVHALHGRYLYRYKIEHVHFEHNGFRIVIYLDAIFRNFYKRKRSSKTPPS